MKAEHRRELQTNVLADQMGRLIKGMKTPGRTSSALGWTFAALIIVAIVVWQYLAGSALTDSSALWLDADAATHDNPVSMMKRLGDLGQDNPGTLAGRTANFELARMFFEEGESVSTSTLRTDSLKSLEHARDLYEELSRNCADEPLLKQEALMGVAKAQESLAGSKNPAATQDDLEKAIASYKRLANAYPDSFLGKAAADRAKALEVGMNEVVKFYQDLYEGSASKPKMEIGATP
jgi:hypothetical protein